MRLIALACALMLFYFGQARAQINLPCSQAAMQFAGSGARAAGQFTNRVMVRDGFATGTHLYQFDVLVGVTNNAVYMYAVQLEYRPETRMCHLVNIGLTGIAY